MKKLLFLLPFIAFLLPVTAQAACGSGYSFCQTMTVQASKVPSTQTNFTVLATTTQAVLKTVANGGHVNNTTTFNGQTAPADLIFSSAADCSAPMSWDIEDYVASTGELEAWVLNSSLSSSVNTVFYMCYGKSSVTTYQGGSVGAAWDSSYVGVYHLANGTTLSANDAKGNNNGTLTNTPTATAGQIDGAANFSSASNQYINLGTNANLYPAAFTYSLWVKGASFPNSYNTTIGNSNGGSKFISLNIKSNGKLAPYIGTTGGTVDYDGTGSNTLTSGTWYYLTMTYSSSVGLVGYVNAGVDGTAGANGTAQNSNSPEIIGGDIQSTSWVNGVEDEVRISNIARPADWITTEFNNQSNVPTFLNIGPEQAAGGGATPLTPFFTLLSGRIIILNGSFIIQ